MTKTKLGIGVAVAACVCAAVSLWAWRHPPGSPMPDWVAPQAGDDAFGALSAQAEEGLVSDRLLPGLPVATGMTVGGGARFDNLHVFPVHAVAQHDVGTIVAARQASEGGRVEIRELGGYPATAEVNQVSIHNREDWPALVLGGTILEGGFQDRLLSGDLLVEPRASLSVEVYCAERSRWSALRKRRNTHGRFQPLPFLAGVEIWTAGHFERDQGQVWSQVSLVNRSTEVTSMTEALLDTLQEPAFAERRDHLAARIAASFEPLADVVGLAYAIDGEVRSVRTFANASLFDMFRETLSQTAAHEALTAQARAGMQMQREAGEVAPERGVQAFIHAIVERPLLVDELTAVDGSKRRYYVATRGWGVATLVPAAGATPGAPEVPLTTAFVARM